ncbi:hypothetical protein [Polaromonas sp. JS666]|uniref:hypothetical protein n=1 Tax=Polaromonas sp. (strain JS666 / ATCC BAA-500) TaxID=296591 RepID=UPI00087FA582|nr:hypothetical protein [Polaromonas sp. JS666]SDM43246.1 hypothetical protein SAMN05720382_101328 [Polaromonas sp. JS666]
MLFALETRTRDEIALEILRLARRDERMTGLWPKTEPVIMVDQLAGGHSLEKNWRLIIPYGCGEELAASLQDAAAAVQAKWRLQLPFLGSSAFYLR